MKALERPATEASADEPGWRAHWRSIVTIASGISVIVGVFVSVGHFRDFVENSIRGDMSKRLAALQQVKEFLAEDARIARCADRFLSTRWPTLQTELPSRVQARNGRSVYLSEEMSDYAAVHYHYEQLGALVKLRYIEFPLVFEIIAFPDEYMEATASAQAALAASWYGPNKPLKDFGANIRWLQRCYQHSRKLPHGQTPACPTE
ncbi:hypothetical protein RQP53_02915 [Paucibacter sp. APW11]|uniref:Uncharacterized protein n=1 Tax=Roseateles aquae TaxID=3077235 RepID=A0ABU3P6M4_9BURK|nr:hypothetical protein [Paucibacter sp. APW11]MDT8998222.1 hypothetical protein [Paucibacter sp. APW11]